MGKLTRQQFSNRCKAALVITVIQAIPRRLEFVMSLFPGSFRLERCSMTSRMTIPSVIYIHATPGLRNSVAARRRGAGVASRRTVNRLRRLHEQLLLHTPIAASRGIGTSCALVLCRRRRREPTSRHSKAPKASVPCNDSARFQE